MNNKLSTPNAKTPFESIKHINEFGAEYWSARELYVVLEYTNYRNFSPVINKAIIACENSRQNVSDHFAQVRNMINIGKGAKREVDDFYLSRYVCYLIVQNGDPKKDVIALGQTYFAIQTRKQEIQDEFEQLSEIERRVHLRNEVKIQNKNLTDAAKEAGLKESKDYAIFHNYGYMGLYGGLKAEDLKNKRGLGKKQQILDYMGTTELVANLFRVTQTEEKIRKDNVRGKDNANYLNKQLIMNLN